MSYIYFLSEIFLMIKWTYNTVLNCARNYNGTRIVDGIVVTIKRIATQKTIQWKLSITDALVFYQAVRNECKVNVLFCLSQYNQRNV